MEGFSAVLPAAGESTRMSQQKALLPWKGTTLLLYQVHSLLDAGAAELIVVLGYRAESLRSLIDGIPGVVPVLNLRYRTGKASSIRAGLRQVDPYTQSVLVLALDQPRSPALVRSVVEAHQRRGAHIAYPTYHGRGGHPVVFSAALLPEMLRIRESRRGLREVVERHRSEVLGLEMDDQEALLDLNRPEEYERAVATATAP